jgi:hypothetical protein
MKLIIEEINPSFVQCISEEKDGKKTLYIEGIFMQSDIPNKNNRRYASHIMEREVGRYMKEAISNRRAYGELGHPQGPTINLDRVSHLIESLKIDGKNVVGKAKILDTPMGNIAKGLIEGGANLGVSSRGLGSLKPAKDGIMEVQDDFKLCTAADIVADPSAPDAFVQGIMESKEWIFENGEWVAKTADIIKKEVKKLSVRQLEEQKLRLLKHFLKTL